MSEQDNRWFKGDRVTREQFAFNIGEFSYHDLIFIAQFPWDVTYRWAIPGRQRQGWARTQRFMISFALSSDGVEIANVSERLENPDYEGVVDHTIHRTGRSVFILNKHQMEDKDSLNDAFLVWGKQYFFLPPSSPDYDPTKLAKAWIKEEIERRGEELAGDIDMSAARDVVESAVKSITEEQAREWFKQLRMTALGYRPLTIEACTGVTERMVHDILESFAASGYSLPVVSPTLVQSLYPPPSAHIRAPSGSTRGAPALEVAPPPPAQAAPGQGRVQPANTGSHIIYQSSPNRRPLSSSRQVSVVASLPPVPTEARSAPVPTTKWSPVKFPRPVIPAPSSFVPKASGVASAEQVASAKPPAAELVVSTNLPDPARDNDQRCSEDIGENDIQHLRNYLRVYPNATLSGLSAVLLQRRVVIDAEPNKHVRAEYALCVGELELEQLVFIGQISCDVRYGWSILGRPRRARTQKFMVGFALSCEGCVVLRVSMEDAGEQTYASFVGYALGWMQAFPKPKSVLVLHRRGVSEGDKVLGDIKSCGMKHLFLPPGSSDYNPTKQAISLIKSNIADAQTSLGEADTKEDAEAILHHNVFKIEKEQAQEWFRECGYAYWEIDECMTSEWWIAGWRAHHLTLITSR
ncbi:hypothetical protein FRC08_002799 [Ceratobasidium sp. 394]|nr:hypothetical protein FRC08_002799 [Ceratobasidium sp. 394]